MASPMRNRTTSASPGTMGRCDRSASRRTASSCSAAAKTTRFAFGTSPAGEAVKALRGHGRAVRACAFSPDGQWVLSGGDDERVRVWNVQGYQETRVLHATVFAGHEDAVLSARFSRDGKQIVTASRDRTASLWDAASGKPLKRFEEGHEFLVSGAVFLPDKKHLATGAGDNSVRIWDLTAGTQQAVLTPTGRIGTLAASPDGNWIATGSPGTDIKLWNARTGEARGNLSGHEAEVSALMFSPAGDRLVSGDNRGHVRVWRKDARAERLGIRARTRRSQRLDHRAAIHARWQAARYGQRRPHAAPMGPCDGGGGSPAGAEACRMRVVARYLAGRRSRTHLLRRRLGAAVAAGRCCATCGGEVARPAVQLGRLLARWQHGDSDVVGRQARFAVGPVRPSRNPKSASRSAADATSRSSISTSSAAKSGRRCSLPMAGMC